MITIEDELALIKRNRAPDAPPVDAPAPAGLPMPPGPDQTQAPDAPAPDRLAPAMPVPDTDAALGLPPRETGLAPLPDDDADAWDVMGAAWRAETIRTDAWNYTERLRRDLTEKMWAKLPDEARQRVMDIKWDQQNNWMRFEDLVADELARLAQSGPEAAADLAGLPLSREAFEGTILNQRRAELDEAQAVLDQPGGAAAEFIGAGARAMTDATSLMLLPFGVSGSAWRVIAGEALLGAAGEAAVLPREFQVARELDQPEPDALARIGLGAVLGGGLAGAVTGSVRIVNHLRNRRAALRAATPDGVDEIDAEAAVDAAEAQMRGDETVAEVIGRTSPAEAAPGTLGAILRDTGASADEMTVLRQIVAVESGGRANAQAASSSARGLGQFIESTWLTMIERYRPDLMEGRTRNELLNLRDDPQLNADMTLAFMRENRSALRAAGLPDGPGETYLAHFMGVGGATRALRAPLDAPISTVMDAKAIAANAGIRFNGRRFADFTVYDLRQWATAKMQGSTARTAMDDMPIRSGTSRGYTGSGQVTAGDGMRVDVTYEVVDASSMSRASGDMQPRDRSRGASDAWIADTAARLDPAQLMPSPTADRGTPIVGPDDMIESGNGRYGAILRAYERFPDRAAAYRAAIEAAGFVVPEGVQRPVLIARRTSDLSPEDRVRFAIEAQDSGVAVMSPTEMARAFGRALTGPALARLDPALPLTDAANSGFVRAALANLPRSARNAMFDGQGLLNRLGDRQLREAIFARAWSDPDIIEMFSEEAAGDLRGLMDALSTAAPDWAALKADIEAGLVRPEMDISGHVLDAMRLIGRARQLSRRDGLPIGTALSDLLDEVDLLTGPVAPLTTALVRKFWVDGKAAPSGQVTEFLRRYAQDARKAGQAGGLFDAPGPADVLRAIDPKTFADLPADLGPVRGFARPAADAAPAPIEPAASPDLRPVTDDSFDAGAASPEVEDLATTIRDEIEGPQVEVAPVQDAELRSARDELSLFLDAEINLGDGTKVRARDVLDDLDADAGADAVLQACGIGGER